MSDEDPLPPEAAALEMAALIVPLAPGGPPGGVSPEPPRGRENIGPPLEPATRPRHPFEVYVRGLAADNFTASCRVAWGTIIADALAGELRAITGMIVGAATSFTIAADDHVWIEVAFDSGGTITACEIKHGVPASNGWAAFPAPYLAVGTGSKWFHLLAQIRPFEGFYSSGATPDSGEIPITLTPSAMTGYVIAQCTNTHLVATKDCIGLAQQRVWHLKPWHGARIA